MAVTSTSNSITFIPKFVLPDLDGVSVNSDEAIQGKVSVVMFTCNHCPYVKLVETDIGRISKARTDVSWLAICSNDVTSHPDDDVSGLREQVQRAEWAFPYLVDTDQRVAHAFGAACTPDFFVFDDRGELRYRGAMDEARPGGDSPVDGVFLLEAIDSAKAWTSYQGGRPSMGCGIKWKEQ